MAFQVVKYVARCASLAVAKMAGSGNRYLRSLGDRYLGSTWEGSQSTAAKASTQELIGIGKMGLFLTGRNLSRVEGDGCGRPAKCEKWSEQSKMHHTKLMLIL